LTVTNGTFTQQAGATLDGGGSFTMSGGTANINSAFTLSSIALASVTANFAVNLSTATTAFTLGSSTVNVTGTFTNPVGQTQNLSYTLLTTTGGTINQGTLIANGTSSITGPFTNAAGATLRLQPDGTTGFSNLTVNSSFTNQGTIDLTSTGSAYSAQLIMPTTATLTNFGTISSTPGSGGARTLQLALNNENVVTVNQPLTINGSSATHLNDGTITGNADITIQQGGTSPSFNNSSSITLGAGVTMLVTGGSFSMAGGGTVTGGTLTLNSVSSTLASNLAVSTLNVNGGTAAFPGNPTLAGLVINLASGALTSTGAMSLGTGQTLNVNSGSLSTATGFTNNGTVIIDGNLSVTGALTNASAGTLRVRGNAAVGGATLNMTSGTGLTNNGTLELTSIGASQNSATIVVNTGTVTNNGTLSTVVGAGGARAISGSLNNGAAGIINLGVGGTGVLTVSGGFTNAGTLNFKLNGNTAGTFDQIAVTGAATLGGTVNTSLVSGFTPAAATQFNILTFASRTGTITTFNHPAAGWTGTNAATDVHVTSP
jgi:hypothetical protein